MRLLTLLPYYIHWHYSRALYSVAHITQNIIWFLWHFFSIKILFHTLFAPWQRLQEDKKHGFDIEGALSSLMINSVMRIVGMIIRLTFIIIGLAAIILSVCAGVLVFVVWLALPLVTVFLIIFGFSLIVRS